MSNWPFMLWQLSMLTISIVIENSIIIGTKQLHTPVLQQCAKNTHIQVDDKYSGSIVKTMKHVCLTASCSRLQPLLKGNIFCLQQPSSLVLNADIQNSIGGGLASVIHSFVIHRVLMGYKGRCVQWTSRCGVTMLSHPGQSIWNANVGRTGCFRVNTQQYM